jgi:Uma2 family endonuclease
MVTPVSIATPSTLQSGEKRVTLRGVSWQGYQDILQALPQTRAAQLTYDDGTLEITMPLEDHEQDSELIGLFIRVLVVEMGLKLKSMRSTTLDRQDLNRGAEPDNAYYIQNQPQVAGRKVDLEKDPPPDLVVEVDITHTDLDKNRLYASLGVPEFWRFNGQVWKIWQLQGKAYV